VVGTLTTTLDMELVMPTMSSNQQIKSLKTISLMIHRVFMTQNTHLAERMEEHLHTQEICMELGSKTTIDFMINEKSIIKLLIHIINNI